MIPFEPMTRGPITREHLQAYSQASEDHNPIHLNEALAKEAGFPTVIVHGMLSMAMMGDYLLKSFPSHQYQLLKFRSKFKRVTFAGDTLTFRGELKKKSSEGRLYLVFLTTENQKGEITLEGEAEIKQI